MPRFRLGERVKFKAVVKKDYEERRTIFVRDEKLPAYYDTWGSPAVPYDEGIIFGYRHVTPGQVHPGTPSSGFFSDDSEPPQFVPDKDATRKVWLVSFDLRRKPVMVFDEDIESIDGDRLLPYQHQKPVKLDDGTKVWPGDPRWGIRARTPMAPDYYVEQVVVAHSLKGALEAAMEIPLIDWMPPEIQDRENEARDS